jgi:hypothetical protein
MRHIPILILAVAALCAEDTTTTDQKPHKPNREAREAAIAKAFTTGDADADGKLTRAEFAVAAEAMHAARPVPPAGKDGAKPPAPPTASAEMLDKAFAAGDANADASLDKAEFAVALKALRPPRGDKGKGGEQGDKGDQDRTPPPPRDE